MTEGTRSRREARRAFLRTAAHASMFGAVSACAPRPFIVEPEPRRRFARVNVSADRVIRTVAGLRPFRPSGFVVRGQRMGEKLLVHNYGHGGGGITLSWGTPSKHDVEHRRRSVGTIYGVRCGKDDRRVHPFPARYARRFTTMLVETSLYLETMLREFRIAGGKVTSSRRCGKRRGQLIIDRRG